MNRTNLTPATTAAILSALTEAAERTERDLKDFNESDPARERVSEIVAQRQVAEGNAQQARQALAEFREVAGIDEDPGEVTHV